MAMLVITRGYIYSTLRFQEWRRDPHRPKDIAKLYLDINETRGLCMQIYHGFDTKQGVTPARHDKCFMQNHVFFEPRNHIAFLGYAVLNTSQMARYFFLVKL